MSIRIIDNFLDKEYFDKIQSHIEGCHFPWNYRESTNPVDNIDSNEFTPNCKRVLDI